MAARALKTRHRLLTVCTTVFRAHGLVVRCICELHPGTRALFQMSRRLSLRSVVPVSQMCGSSPILAFKCQLTSQYPCTLCNTPCVHVYFRVQLRKNNYRPQRVKISLLAKSMTRNDFPILPMFFLWLNLHNSIPVDMNLDVLVSEWSTIC